MLLLPHPEGVINKTMVKIKDRIECGCVVFPHLAVGAFDGVCIKLRGEIEAADGQVNTVVRTFQRCDWRHSTVRDPRSTESTRCNSRRPYSWAALRHSRY